MPRRLYQTIGIGSTAFGGFGMQMSASHVSLDDYMRPTWMDRDDLQETIKYCVD